MKKVWFFDLDGTLADTDLDIRLTWKATLGALGLESPDFDEKYVTGPPIREILKLLFPDRYTPELEEAARLEFGRRYDSGGFPNTAEYSGVLDAVKAIRAAGAAVFIVTNKRWLGARAMAAKFGWPDVFDALYTGDMPKKDPSLGVLRKPEVLAMILAERGFAAADCVMVGDTTNDFEAARKNSIESVAVTWGYGTEAEYAEADRRADAPRDLLSFAGLGVGAHGTVEI